VDSDFRSARAAAALRASLASAFGLLTIIALVLSLTAGLTIWAAVACAAATSATLVVGRRAVIAEQRLARSVQPPVRQPVPDAAASPRPDAAADARVESRAQPSKRPADASIRRPERAKTSGRDAAAGGAVAGGAAAGDAAVGGGAAGTGTTASAAKATATRRPGISGRMKAGRTVYYLPESVSIKPLEADESASSVADEEASNPPAKTRRFTTARPTPAPVVSQSPAAGRPAPSEIGAKPTKTPAPTSIPAPTYTMMSGAPKWEPRQLTDLDYAQARQAAAAARERAAAEARAEGVETAATGELRIPGRVVFADGALDLDRAIAARRRAAGH
jgi:hypothetical protein